MVNSMDLFSYLLGKKSGGGGAPSSEVKAILDPTKSYNYQSAIKGYIISIDLFDTSELTSFRSFFNRCTNLETIPLFDTSNVTDFRDAFSYCENLKNIPIFNTSKATNMSGMFSRTSVTKLTDESLDNILQMCINATSYTGTKSLTTIGFTSGYYPSSRIQALPHYQDFINAGWTIGY